MIPYGNPVTFFNPEEDYERKKKFLNWVHNVENNPKYKRYKHVQLLKTEDIEKANYSIIEGGQQSQTSFVPNSGDRFD